MEQFILTPYFPLSFYFLQFSSITLATILSLSSLNLFLRLKKIFEKTEKYSLLLIILHVSITLISFFFSGIESFSELLLQNEETVIHNFFMQLIIFLLLIANAIFQLVITKSNMKKCGCMIKGG